MSSAISETPLLEADVTVLAPPNGGRPVARTNGALPSPVKVGTLAPIRFFLYPLRGRWQAYTLEQIAGKRVRTGSVDREGDKRDAEGAPLAPPKTKVLSTEEDVSDWKPEGRWHEITLVDEWLGEHHEKLEAAITDLTTGRRDPRRWTGALISLAVPAWTLSEINPAWTPTEAGFKRLPIELYTWVGAMVSQAVYGALSDDPDFFDG